MKIRTKMIIAFVAVILMPIFLIVLSFFLLNHFQLKNVRESYGITSTEEILSSNSMQLVSALTSSIREKLDDVAANHAGDLEDTDYLNELNAELSERESFLIVLRGEELYYNGNPDQSEDLTKLLPAGSQTENSGNEEGQNDVFFLSEDRCLVTYRHFSFQDGTDGSLYLVTELEKLLPAIRSILVNLIIVAILVLVVTALIIVTWLYGAILKPIAALQKATRSIRDGNLDFSLEVTGKDEISELCRDFENMRIRLKETAEEKVQYDRENKELISNISHDLKTPLTAVKGYCEGILDGVAASPEKLEKYIRTIYNKANDMEKLIDELTLYSKIDTNRIPYNFTKISVSDYFGDCAEELKLELEARGVELTYSNYLTEDVTVIGDAEQLKRVVNNIISNSLKYMDKKKAFINLRIHDDGDFICVELEDNGRGIAAKDIPYIFDRFFRADASRNSRAGGSGIGLSIVRKIIEDHGGRIWATSKEGTGTIMHFVLRKYQEVPYE